MLTASGQMMCRGGPPAPARRDGSQRSTSSGASATLSSPRRIPFACRSPARSFKRVLWVTPLSQNYPQESFGVANPQGEGYGDARAGGNTLRTNCPSIVIRRAHSGTPTTGTPKNAQACPCTCPFHGNPQRSQAHVGEPLPPQAVPTLAPFTASGPYTCPFHRKRSPSPVGEAKNG